MRAFLSMGSLLQNRYLVKSILWSNKFEWCQMNSVKQMFSEQLFLEALTKNNEEIYQWTNRAYGHSKTENNQLKSISKQSHQLPCKCITSGPNTSQKRFDFICFLLLSLCLLFCFCFCFCLEIFLMTILRSWNILNILKYTSNIIYIIFSHSGNSF